MNAQGGHCERLATLVAAAVMTFLALCPAETFGQLGARSHVQRQLGGRAGGQEAAPTGQPGSPDAALSDDDLKKIEEAKTVQELTDLGKLFLLTQKREAAAAVVEEIIARQPELLEDAQRQSPRSWNEFWFTQRAKMREAKLGPKDTAGRLEIAVWLHDAGFSAAARAVLKTAVGINREDPAVKELAEKWNLFRGGPVRFDLSCGLKEPLIRPTMQDEGQVVSPRMKDRVFLILPIAYDAFGQRLLINKTDIQAKGDDDRPYSVTGLALMQREGGSGSASSSDPLADRGRVPDVKLQAGTEPLWEQMQVQPTQPPPGQVRPGPARLNEEPLLAAGTTEPEIILKNIMPPIVRPVPGQPRVGPMNRSSRPQETRTSTGYAAYILEIPQTLKTLECSYKKGELQLTLDIEFLQVLSTPLENMQPAERDRLARTLAAHGAAKSAPVASAALRKLNTIRLATAGGQAVGEGALKPSPTVALIEKVLLVALGHESPDVRRDAFDLLSRDSSEEFTEMVAGTSEANVLSNLVAEARAYFADLREALAAAEAAREDASALNPQLPVSIETTATGLPPLPGRQSILRILAGCLQCKEAQVREQALEVVLANPFDQTIGILKNANKEAVTQLLARVPGMEDANLKQAVLRVLLQRPPDTQLSEILAAFKDTPVTISKEDDPILETAIREGQPAEVQRLILELLAKANLSAVSGSEKVRKLIELLTSGEMKPDAKVQAAMLELARNQLKAGYEAPVRRASQSGLYHASQRAAGFDSLLVSVALAPKTDSASSRQAVITLLELGRVRALNERLQAAQAEADPRVQDWIQNLARDKNLLQREALPVFLAGQLAIAKDRTLQLAVTALTAIQKSVPPKDRWKVNLAIKQGMESKQLVLLSTNPDVRISRPALALLRDLAGMTAAEAAEFEGLPDESSRQDKLNTIEQNRSSKAVGSFGCMVYVDVRSNPSARAAQPGGRAAVLERNSVPLPSSVVNLQRAAQGGAVRVIVDGTPIGPPDAKGPGQPSASAGSIPINPALLLRAALNSPEAQKEGLAGKISPASLRSVQSCELKYEQLGAWGAEVTLSDGPDASSGEYPLRIVSAKILLEPMTQ